MLAMKNKKGFAAAALSLALLAGCSGGNAGPSETNEGNTGTGGEPVKISVFVSGSNFPTPDKEPIISQLNEDLNMDMEFIASSEYEQQLNVKIAGGTPPDIYQVTNAQLQSYVKQNLLLELDGYLDQMPNLMQTFTETDYNKGKVNGKIYAISKRSDIPMATYWVRKDWLDNLELAEPTTIEELKEVAIAFTEDDPDQNGQDDTYGFTGIEFAAFEGILAAYGTGLFEWYIRDNEVTYGATSPETKAALEFIRELVELGVVDPELMANKGLQDQDKVFKGKAGIIYRNWGEMVKDNNVETYKSINPDAEWLQLGALAGPGGTYAGSWGEGRSPAKFAISKSVEKNPEKLNKILEYFDYITEPGKGQLTVNYGIEGTHYKMEGDKVVSLPAMSELGYGWMTQLTGRNELEYLSVKFPKQESYIEFAQELPRIPTYSDFVPHPEGVIADDKRKYETEEMTKFIYGKRPLTEFDAFVDTLNSTYQLPLYVDEAKKALTGLGYIK